MLTKILIPIFIFVNTLNVNAQSNSFKADSPVGTKIIVKALPYSNDINKYYFNKDRFKKLAKFLNENPSVYIEVSCYADFTDSPLMNLMATTDQAIEIRKYLVRLKIAGTRIITIGYGDMFPIYKEAQLNEMTEERRKEAELANRRIEIEIIKL